MTWAIWQAYLADLSYHMVSTGLIHVTWKKPTLVGEVCSIEFPKHRTLLQKVHLTEAKRQSRPSSWDYHKKFWNTEVTLLPANMQNRGTEKANKQTQDRSQMNEPYTLQEHWQISNNYTPSKKKIFSFSQREDKYCFNLSQQHHLYHGSIMPG